MYIQSISSEVNIKSIFKLLLNDPLKINISGVFMKINCHSLNLDDLNYLISNLEYKTNSQY
jgi:hypothetical protein